MSLKFLMGGIRVVKYGEDHYSMYVTNDIDKTHSHIGFLKKEDMWKIRGEINNAIAEPQDDDRTNEE